MTDGPTVSRRRVLGAIATVGGASAAAGAGTMALFSDTESSGGNTVQAGTLDLTLANSQNTSVTFLTETGITPGDAGSDSLDLNNEGSVAGDLSVNLDAIRSTDKNGNSPGDLEDYLLVRGVVQELDGSNPVEIFGEQTVNNLRGQTLSHPQITIASGASRQFVLEWDLPTSAKNDAKGDSVEIDFGFTLNQSGP